jgi:putative membrane protein
MSPRLKPLIWTVSIAVPLVVAILLNPRFPKLPDGALGFDTAILSLLNACINGTVSVLLVLGFWCIKNKRREAHKKVMLTAFVLSALFLVSYVLYHLSAGHKEFNGTGAVRGVYFFILITHIVLSAFIIPLASFSIFHALSSVFDKHRRIAKITFPLWLYVAVTGVIVYLMNSVWF